MTHLQGQGQHLYAPSAAPDAQPLSLAPGALASPRSTAG